MEQSSTWKGKGKTRSLRDMRREKQANHISNLCLLLLVPNYRVVWGQVAEDSACKTTCNKKLRSEKLELGETLPHQH